MPLHPRCEPSERPALHFTQVVLQHYSIWGFHSLYFGFKDVLFCAISTKPNAKLINFQHKPDLRKSSYRAGKNSTDTVSFTQSAKAAQTRPELFPTITKCLNFFPSSHCLLPQVQHQTEAGSTHGSAYRPSTNSNTRSTSRGNGSTQVWLRLSEARVSTHWEAGANPLRQLHITFPGSPFLQSRPNPKDSSAQSQLHPTLPSESGHHTIFEQHFCKGSCSVTDSGERLPATYRLVSKPKQTVPAACII